MLRHRPLLEREPAAIFTLWHAAHRDLVSTPIARPDGQPGATPSNSRSPACRGRPSGIDFNPVPRTPPTAATGSLRVDQRVGLPLRASTPTTARSSPTEPGFAPTRAGDPRQSLAVAYTQQLLRATTSTLRGVDSTRPGHPGHLLQPRAERRDVAPIGSGDRRCRSIRATSDVGYRHLPASGADFLLRDRPGHRFVGIVRVQNVAAGTLSSTVGDHRRRRDGPVDITATIASCPEPSRPWPSGAVGVAEPRLLAGLARRKRSAAQAG